MLNKKRKRHLFFFSRPSGYKLDQFHKCKKQSPSWSAVNGGKFQTVKTAELCSLLEIEFNQLDVVPPGREDFWNLRNLKRRFAGRCPSIKSFCSAHSLFEKCQNTGMKTYILRMLTVLTFLAEFTANLNNKRC